MDISEFKLKRSEMELKMLTSLSSILSEFKKETGMCPYGISVEMVDITTFGKPKQSIIGQVKVHFEI